MFGKACRALGLAALITLLAAPLADVALVDESDEETHSLLGSYLAGRIARSQRDNGAAAKFYGYALAKDPENHLLLERTFLLEAIAGNWDRALRFAEDVAENETSNQIARFLLGVKEFKRGNYKESEKHFRSARKGTLPDLTARLSIAWVKLAAGDADAALKELDDMKKADWSHFYQQYHKGLVSDVAGRQKTARKAFADAFKNRPRTLRIAEAYARHASHAGDAELAKKILKKHIGKSMGHPIARTLLNDIEAGNKQRLLVEKPAQGMAEVFYAIGDALTGEDSSEIGLVYLRIALYLKPDFPLAHLSIGEVYDKLEQFDRAIEAYDRVSKKEPIWSNIQMRKAHALNSLEKTEEAKELLEKLAENAPDDMRAFDTLASILRSRQRYEDAEKYYSRAIDLVKNPEERHWTLFYARGVCRERQKNWRGAESDLKMALKLNPDQPLVLNYLGYSWVDQGENLKQAMDLIRKAVKLKPDDGYFVDSLGWAYYRIGKYDTAVKQLERAVELRPDDPVINDHLGDAYWRVSRTLEAKYQWSQALTLEPEEDDEEKIKQKLETGLVEPEKVVVASAPNEKSGTASDTPVSSGIGSTTQGTVAKPEREPEKEVSDAGSAAAAAGKDIKRPDADTVHVVQEGESLWSIAKKYLGNGMLFDRILNSNRTAIDDPNLIFQGQKLRLPDR